MRSEADLIPVQATIRRRLSLDLERMEADPVWIQISEQLGVAPGAEGFEVAVRKYINHYVVRDQFPHLMPSTNGPGDIDEIQIHLEVTWPVQQ